MNYRHKPHKDTRPTLSAAEMQQKVAAVRNLIKEIKMNDNTDIKKDFGQVVADKVIDRINVREYIRKHMDDNGYAVDKCDICNVQQDGNAILFKFVHWSVPTMATEPFYRIEFIIEL